MKKVKGIVLESSKKWTALLTSDGEFIKIADNKGYLPGMEIEIEYPHIRKNNYFKTSIAVASIIVLFSAMLACYNFLMPQAYVALDINPSLLLSLNRCAEVIKVEGVNEDGKIFINNLDLKKKNIDEAINMIIHQAYLDNYLSPEKENVIYISLSSPEHYSLDKDTLEVFACREVTNLGLDAYLKVNTVERKKVFQAKEKNVSVNTLLVREELEVKGLLEEEPSTKNLNSDISIGTLLENVKPATFFDEKDFIAGKKNNAEKNPPDLEKMVSEKAVFLQEAQDTVVTGIEKPEKQIVTEKPDKDKIKDKNKEKKEKEKEKEKGRDKGKEKEKNLAKDKNKIKDKEKEKKRKGKGKVENNLKPELFPWKYKKFGN